MNERWAKLIVESLVEQGVARICLAPGSRITPLAYAAAKEERIETFVHFDERGAAFNAFGYAKASKKPTAVLSTSGSAVGNLMPAVMEASLEGVPLIVITADRPPELRDCGANQTCDQVKVFGSFVRWQADLPCPDAEIPEGFIGSTVAQAVFRSLHSPKGPVHLNCMFREPFFTGSSTIEKASTHYEAGHSVLSCHALEAWGKKLSGIEKGVIIAGTIATARSLKPILALAEKLHWPILADITSGLRSEGRHPNIIPYYDAIIKAAEDLKPEAILHLGDRIVSKSLGLWLKEARPRLYAMVADRPDRHDPYHLLTHRVETDPSLFCEQVLPLVTRHVTWLDIWKHFGDVVENQIDSLAGSLTEPGLARFLHHHLPPHFGLFLANGMPVRDADQFFFPRFYRGPIFAKRGISGIDGNIATSFGIADAVERPVVAILGDQSALHDLNSLAQASKAKHPVIFVIVNNCGSGIFHFLPIAEKKEVFEEFFAAKHSLSFRYGAEMFGIPYQKLTDYAQLLRALKEEKTCVLELATNRVENFDLHTFINSELNRCLSISCTAF